MHRKDADLVNYALGVFENRVGEDVVVGPGTVEFDVVPPHDAVSFTRQISLLVHRGIKDVVMRPTRVTHYSKPYHGIRFTV